MLAGVVAAPLSLLSVTSTPPGPAAADNVTVPVELLPPATGLGTKVRFVIVPEPGPAGLITRGVVAVLFEVALMVAVV